MDGNGRWAKQRGLSRSDGHKAGAEAVRSLIAECRKLDLEYLTLYTFSQENWNRPAEEVTFLFELLVEFLTLELPELHRRNIRLRLLGKLEPLPLAARKTLEHACAKTAGNTAMTLNLALNYSGREEIARACSRIMAGNIPAEAITPELVSEHLYTAGQPDPDLVIRTSGELRISNFLLFQTAYSEFYFTPTLWPDFTAEELHKAIEDFAGRNRRYGKAVD